MGRSEAKTRAPTDAFNPNKNIDEGKIDGKYNYTESEPHMIVDQCTGKNKLVNTLDDKAIKTAEIGRYDLKLDS